MMTRINELNDIIFSLENELELAKDKLASANFQIALYADEVNHLKNRSNNRKLEEDLDNANWQIAIYSSENEELKSEVRYYSMEAKRLLKENDKLRDDYTQLNTTVEELRQERKYTQDWLLKYNISNEDIVNSLTADYEDLRMKHSALRNQNAALMAENKNFKNRYGISELVDENSDLINSIVKARNILDNAIS